MAGLISQPIPTFETAGHQVEIGHGPQGGTAQSMFRCTNEHSLTPLKQPFDDSDQRVYIGLY